MRTSKVIRSFGITLGIIAGTATAAGAVTGGGFPLVARSEPVRSTTTTAKVATEPASTTSTTVAKPVEPSTSTTRVEPSSTRTAAPPREAATPSTTRPPEPTSIRLAESSSTTTGPRPSEPTAPATTRPEPKPTTTAAHPTEPKPTSTTTKPAEPTTTATEVHTAPTLSLSCIRRVDGGRTQVVCEWSGALPVGATHYLLLRSAQQGRVLLTSPDAHRFVDTTLEAGVTYGYAVVAVGDGTGPTLAHSNPISIVG
jgi:hypothetical protein